MFILRIQDRAECGKDTEGGGPHRKTYTGRYLRSAATYLWSASTYLRTAAKLGPSVAILGALSFIDCNNAARIRYYVMLLELTFISKECLIDSRISV